MKFCNNVNVKKTKFSELNKKEKLWWIKSKFGKVSYKKKWKWYDSE